MCHNNFWEREKKRRKPTHKVIEAFVTPKIEYIRRHIKISKDTKILDVGCGNGFFTYYFSKIAYTVGVDYSEYMLLMNPCPRLVRGEAANLPIDNEAFDVVFCSNLLHHVEKPIFVLNEMKRISKRFVIFSEPNRNNPAMFLFSLIKKEERGALKFSRKYMIALAVKANLRVIACHSLGIIFPNKTPKIFLPLLRKIDGQSPLGGYNILIAQK